MYKKDLTHRVTVRLTENIYQGLTELSEFYSVSPSDMIRQLISTNVNTHRAMLSSLKNTVDEVKSIEKTSDKTKKTSNASDKTTTKRQTKSAKAKK